MYSIAPISTGNTSQDILWVHETADNAERYV
jgi:hypothetical protein